MADSGVVNAYWGKDRVTFVTRASDGGIELREELAEHSCFLGEDAIPQVQVDQLRRHPSVWKVVRESGRWLRVKFASRDDCLAFCEACKRAGVRTFEGGVSPVVRAMADRELVTARPRIGFGDIETDSRIPFSRCEETTVLSWAIVAADGRTESDVLKAYTGARERDLLGSFWETMEDFDLLAAWNGDRFDFTVLKARSLRYGLVGGRRDWRRWLWLDQMELFRRMNVSASESGEEKQSVALEKVATALGIEGAEKGFDARYTWQAWLAGGESRRELVRYNVADCRRQRGIEEKTGYVELQLTLSEACGSFPDSRGSQPGIFVESFLQRLAVQRSHKFPTVLERAYGEKFKGALVLDPRCSGIERDVHVCDFKSLYPSIIIAWNMSPETLCDESYSGRSHSPLTGQYFRRDIEGVLPMALRELLRMRDYWKKLKASLPPGTREWKEADRRATAYKIAANSFYGVIGQGVSRFFRREVAESVTQCGVWLLERTIEEAERRGMRVVYGDTDSLFIAGASRGEFEAFVRECNDVLYPKVMAEFGADASHIKLAYEKQFNRLVMVSKKRYAGSYLHFEGTPATIDSRPEIKGLEYKRGDALRLALKLQEEVVHHLVGYKTEPKDLPHFRELMERWRTRVLGESLAVEDVLVSKRLSKPLEEYARKMLKDGSGYARRQPHIELAAELTERGFDAGAGAKIEYVVVGPCEKPQRVVAAMDWDGELDRTGLWIRQVAPPTVRLLEAAFPGGGWDDYLDGGSLAAVEDDEPEAAE